MTVLSKEEFYRITTGQSCHTFVHPWSDGCLRGIFDMFLSASVGSAKFTTALCLLQIAAKGKQITKEQLINIIIYGIRLTLCGSTLGTSVVSVMCLERRIFGKFEYHTVMLIPGICSGLSIFIVPKSRRHLFISAMACASIETILHAYTKNGKISVLKQTLFFMITNSLFMYFLKLWKSNRSDQVAPNLWFFSPSHPSNIQKNINNQSTSSDEKRSHKIARPCDHIQSCIKSILKESSNYFWCGTAIEMIRIFTSNFKIFARKPKKIISILSEKTTMRLAAFAALYVFLFKVTHCALCRFHGKDKTTNTLVAGLVSGLAYYLHPSLSLNITVFVNLVHTIWRYFNANEKFMNDLPTSELLFMIFCGFLFHSRVFIPDYCSKFFINMISLATKGKGDQMYIAFSRALQ